MNGQPKGGKKVAPGEKPSQERKKRIPRQGPMLWGEDVQENVILKKKKIR